MLTTVTLLVCGLLSALGQGSVEFRNYLDLGSGGVSPSIDARVSNSVTGRWLDSAEGVFRASLIGGPTTNAISTSYRTLGNLAMCFSPYDTTVTWVGFNSSPQTATGADAVGYISVGSHHAAQRAVPGAPYGEPATLQMVAWSGNYNTWQEAWTAAQSRPEVLIGFSAPLLFYWPPPDAPAPYYLFGLNGFSIGPVPEPSGLALFGWASLTVLVARNRRTKGLSRRDKLGM